MHRFLKVTMVQELTQDGARRLAGAAARLAGMEGLGAHRLSITLRAGAGRGSPPSAVLFDFNGVLVDDEDFHWRAFREIVGPLGVRLSRRRYDARYLVFDDRNALAAMLRDSGIDAPAARLKTLVRRKRALYRRVAAGVRIGGRDAALVRAIACRVPVAVVSGAARWEIQAALRRARLTGAIGAVVAAEDVKRPKPAPDGYLLALRRLGLGDGRRCLALEDSPGGVRAARAAGLTVIGVGTSFTPAALRRAGAARVVPRLGALSVEEVLSTR